MHADAGALFVDIAQVCNDVPIVADGVDVLLVNTSISGARVNSSETAVSNGGGAYVSVCAQYGDMPKPPPTLATTASNVRVVVHGCDFVGNAAGPAGYGGGLYATIGIAAVSNASVSVSEVFVAWNVGGA